MADSSGAGAGGGREGFPEEGFGRCPYNGISW